MAKMWAGRFEKDTDQRVNDFNSSIKFDCRLFEHDILGSIAHATMLHESGIIDQDEGTAIIDGLNDILVDLKSGKLDFDPTAEDIHMFIEAELTSRLGDAGKRLHTARSRNDQVALDLRMYLLAQCDDAISMLTDLTRTICTLAEKHTETIMPGYTHLQRAQPITFAHHLMAYAQMFLRDIDRFKDTKKRMNSMPLGSGALASTTYPINRQRVCDLLGFDEVTQNSLDGVSDRDFCIEYASSSAILMMHLSRLCEEVILWCSWEFKFIELDDAYATGSSIMPQKKNPDVAELIRGKTGRVIGSLVTLLSMMKSLSLAYNKDMQEDKEAVFDIVDTLKLCITTLDPMLETMTVNKDNMRLAAAKGFINATDCADYLVKKGMPFRDAYKITGELVAICIKKDLVLETLPLDEYKAICDIFSEDIYKAIDLITCVNERNVIGGPSSNAVVEQIKYVRNKL